MIEVKKLNLGYGDNLILQDISFAVKKGDIFVIMGASGSGKSTILRALTGILKPKSGHIMVDGEDFYKNPTKLINKFGVMYQSGALFSSMTLAENIALAIEQYTDYSKKQVADLVRLKLALVGLDGYQDFYPSEISGGMRKRAGFARALALDPQIVYFDEPSAGLDPVSAHRLDELILDINQSLGTTIVMVTHDLSSIFAVGRNAIFVDADTKTIQGCGNPEELLKNPPNDKVYNFLTGGK